MTPAMNPRREISTAFWLIPGSSAFTTSFLLALAAEVFKLGVNDIAFRRTL